MMFPILIDDIKNLTPEEFAELKPDLLELIKVMGKPPKFEFGVMTPQYEITKPSDIPDILILKTNTIYNPKDKLQ